MTTDLLAAARSGVWLTGSDASVAAVQRVEADAVQPGGVRIRVKTPDPEALMNGTGCMQVHDLDHGLEYCVQALTCRPVPGGCELTASTLGEPVHSRDRGHGVEDYIVFPGCAPVRVTDMRMADGACPRGLHLRAEISAAEWSRLPIRRDGSVRCRCGASGCACAPRGGTRGQERNCRWTFAPLRLKAPADQSDTPVAESDKSEVNVELVRLAQRCTLRVGLYVAMPGCADRPAVVIGHVISTESWHTELGG